MLLSAWPVSKEQGSVEPRLREAEGATFGLELERRHVFMYSVV